MHMRLFCLPLFVLLLGCAGQHGVAGANQDTSVTPNTPPRELVTPYPFTVLDARVEADSLVVRLQFGGGFKTHDFTLVSEGAATKSLPRQQPLQLVHDAHSDMGRALIERTRSFDLQPFRDPAQPRILIALRGWPEMLEYTYPQ